MALAAKRRHQVVSEFQRVPNGYFRFHLSGTLAYRHYHVDILAVLKDDDSYGAHSGCMPE